MTTGTAHFVVIGNPKNRRVTLFQDALARRGLAPAEVIGYRELLLSGRPAAEFLAGLPAHSVLRIDSPGEDFAVLRALLARGADAEGRENA